MNNSDKKEESRIPELVDEIVSYLYGIYFLGALIALMLLLHISLDIYFHN